jgi:hypothetical protein
MLQKAAGPGVEECGDLGYLSPEHLCERANKAILTELNFDHLNNAVSEATANAFILRGNSPLCTNTDIDDFVSALIQ